MRAPSFCSVILAAGESSRMGTDKALLPWHGSTFLGAAIEALYPFSDYVIVVAGKNAERLRPVADSGGAYLIVNPHAELGQFTSLQAGLREVLNRGRDTAIVALVDRPPPSRETISQLQEAFLQAAQRGKWALIPQYRERHGHPIIVGPELLPRFLNAPAIYNARDVLHEHQDRIEYFSVEDPLVAANVDTPEQYADLTAHEPSN